jgi:hypothetical protein
MSERPEVLVRKRILFTVIICTLLILCVGLSHEVKAADNVKTGTLSMKQQHATMEALDQQWTKVKDAVKKGDYAVASRGIVFMERRLVPDTAKLRPHRHAGKRDQYLRYNEDFVQSLGRLRMAIATKDAPLAAPELVKAVEGSCKQCHDMFAGGHH